jgi:hypothetical protein
LTPPSLRSSLASGLDTGGIVSGSYRELWIWFVALTVLFLLFLVGLELISAD